MITILKQKNMKKVCSFFGILFFVFTMNGQNNFDTKKVEKDFVRVQPCYQNLSRCLYAGKFELTNAQYNLFLEDLKKLGNTSLYNSCQRDGQAWNKFDFGHNDPLVKNYGSHPAYNEYPVVCISYESAVAYCNWLTTKYKESGKGKYKDVVFRLPSKGEWMAAADCMPQAPYPWYGIFPYGESGCYRCNIRCDTSNWIRDGAFYPVEKSSYFPNKLGIYNIVGNVAEMISDKGIAKGGSWYNFPDDAIVQKEQKYNTADPGVGVRIFMEVSEPMGEKSKRVYAIQ